ncbi:hypothetical protein MUG84_22415 [Paenibacillus sp. KQZ6P-2]|uniref:LexA repressor DNA-binding domain-containing protein n=1 Tax=Paenibacillus mangrovi TaxID=2931978 RepID=A0A9X1WVS3_9BACL|nr:hypothetical protein [Paenibacillus mangrovi]MCJ8014458.1 hypothetical protein [Paenibacillus mangrovi]
MLADMERKILRILFNFLSGRRRLPTIHELEIKTGKRKDVILHSLHELERLQYIEWKDKASVQSIVIIEKWEREEPAYEEARNQRSHQQVIREGNTDYWTMY